MVGLLKGDSRADRVCVLGGPGPQHPAGPPGHQEGQAQRSVQAQGRPGQGGHGRAQGNRTTGGRQVSRLFAVVHPDPESFDLIGSGSETKT